MKKTTHIITNKNHHTSITHLNLNQYQHNTKIITSKSKRISTTINTREIPSITYNNTNTNPIQINKPINSNNGTITITDVPFTKHYQHTQPIHHRNHSNHSYKKKPYDYSIDDIPKNTTNDLILSDNPQPKAEDCKVLLHTIKILMMYIRKMNECYMNKIRDVLRKKNDEIERMGMEKEACAKENIRMRMKMMQMVYAAKAYDEEDIGRMRMVWEGMRRLIMENSVLREINNVYPVNVDICRYKNRDNDKVIMRKDYEEEKENDNDSNKRDCNDNNTNNDKKSIKEEINNKAKHKRQLTQYKFILEDCNNPNSNPNSNNSDNINTNIVTTIENPPSLSSPQSNIDIFTSTINEMTNLSKTIKHIDNNPKLIPVKDNNININSLNILSNENPTEPTPSLSNEESSLLNLSNKTHVICYRNPNSKDKKLEFTQ